MTASGRKFMKCARVYTFMAVVGLSITPLFGQGIVVVQKETRNGQTTTTSTYLDKGHLRGEVRSGNDDGAIIFDATRHIVQNLNLTKKTYSETSKTDMQQMGSQLGALAEIMQAQLQNMTPEQRAAMERLMQGRGGAGVGAGLPAVPAAGAPATKVVFQPAGTEKSGPWTCAIYQGTVGGQKTADVCTVDPKELGVAASDFEVTRQLDAFMRTIAPAETAARLVLGTVQEQGFPGVPVRRTLYRNGTVYSVLEITEVRREAIPASTFEVPVGFVRETLLGLGR